MREAEYTSGAPHSSVNSISGVEVVEFTSARPSFSAAIAPFRHNGTRPLSQVLPFAGEIGIDPPRKISSSSANSDEWTPRLTRFLPPSGSESGSVSDFIPDEPASSLSEFMPLCIAEQEELHREISNGTPRLTRFMPKASAGLTRSGSDSAEASGYPPRTANVEL